MTFSALAARLMAYYSPEEQSIPDNSNYPGRNAAVLGVINGALQELYGESGPWPRKRSAGAWIEAPATSIPISVTNGSTAASIGSGSWQSWFAGCTIAIAGSTIDNRIMNDVAASLVLKFPHEGPTGTLNATVYHDSITLPSDVAAVLEPVRVQGLRMSPMTNPGEGLTSRAVDDYAFRRKTLDVVQIPSRLSTRLARPAGYYVDSWIPNATTNPRYRMILSTAPAERMQLEYEAKLTAPIGTALNSDEIPVPLDYVDSLLFPVACQKLTGTPFFRNESAKAEIGRSFQEAQALIKSMRPRTRSNSRVRPTH